MGNSMTLHSACARGDIDVIRLLLKSSTAAQVEEEDENGRTPLVMTIAHCMSPVEEIDDEWYAELEKASTMKEGGSDDDSDEGDSSRIDASVSRRMEILSLLLSYNANVHHQDDKGWTALHYACHASCFPLVNLLLEYNAEPVRNHVGLLPQDLLNRGHLLEHVDLVEGIRYSLQRRTPSSDYSIQLLAFRPSGIIQLDLGAQVQRGAKLTIDVTAPENHSNRDYIQLIFSEDDSTELQTTSYYAVPKGSHSQITIDSHDIPSDTFIHFVYVQSDINAMRRQVVASGCNAMIQDSVGEIFQFELYLYERLVEVESTAECDFIDQPSIMLKRIGKVDDATGDIDWVQVQSNNCIVAVNDGRIDNRPFTEAIKILQEHNGNPCTKLLVQNYVSCGDFIPEKVLGIGVVGKFALLHPKEEVQVGSMKQWLEDDASRKVDDELVEEIRQPNDASLGINESIVSSDETTSKQTQQRLTTKEMTMPLHSQQLVPTIHPTTTIKYQ